MQRVQVMLIGIVVALCGCAKTPVAVDKTTNSEINVELLFEHDGCKIYRFTDHGDPVYYTKCQGQDSSQASWNKTVLAGKVLVISHKQVPTGYIN